MKPSQYNLIERQLHENMSRFFSLLLPWRDAVTEEIEVPDWRLRGARPQYDASPSWLDSSCLICFVN